MPKVIKCPEQLQREATAAFKHEILMQRTDLGIRQHDIALAMGLSDPAVSIMFKDIDKLSIPRIRKLVQILGINPVTILRWLGYTDGDIKKLQSR